MIIENKTKSFQIGGEKIQTGLSPDDVEHLLGLLTSNLYSDKWSFCREILSNSVDIHKSCLVNKKVDLYISVDNLGKYVAFKDYGCGISPEFMETTFSQFGKSTKRDNNECIGGFGIGKASLLAYNDRAYFITNVDKIQYTYLLTKNNGAEFNLINQEVTEEENGTLVKIYIPKGWAEESTLKEEIHNKCVYFEGVSYEGFKNPLIKHETFWYSEDFKGDDSVHIVCGGCYYQLPYEKLGLSKIKVPVALPFSIGELEYTPNREELRLNKVSSELIKTRLNNFIEYCKKIAPLEYDNLIEYLDSKDSGSFNLRGTNLFIKYRDIGLVDDIEFTPLKDIDKKVFNIYNAIGTFRIDGKKLININEYKTLKYSRNFYIKDENFLNEKYFREFMQSKQVIEFPIVNLTFWKKHLNLFKVPKSEWRNHINIFLNWFESIYTITKFSEVKTSEKFLEFVKREKLKNKTNRTYTASQKRDNITHVARWSQSGNTRVVWETIENLDPNQEVLVVTSKTSKETVEFLNSLVSRTDIQVVKGKEENYDWIFDHDVVVKCYYANIIDCLFYENRVWFGVAKNIVESPYKILEDYKRSNKPTIGEISEEIFHNKIKLYVEEYNLEDDIQCQIDITKQLIEKYDYFKHLEQLKSYYYKDELTSIFNLIEGLKKENKELKQLNYSFV